MMYNKWWGNCVVLVHTSRCFYSYWSSTIRRGSSSLTTTKHKLRRSTSFHVCLLFVIRRIVRRFIWPAHASCHVVRRGFGGHRSPTKAEKTAPRLEEPRHGRSWPQYRQGGPAARPVVGCDLRCRRLPSPPRHITTDFCSFQLAPSSSNVDNACICMRCDSPSLLTPHGRGCTRICHVSIVRGISVLDGRVSCCSHKHCSTHPTEIYSRSRHTFNLYFLLTRFDCFTAWICQIWCNMYYHHCYVGLPRTCTLYPVYKSISIMRTLQSTSVGFRRISARSQKV